RESIGDEDGLSERRDRLMGPARVQESPADGAMRLDGVASQPQVIGMAAGQLLASLQGLLIGRQGLAPALQLGQSPALGMVAAGPLAGLRRRVERRQVPEQYLTPALDAAGRRQPAAVGAEGQTIDSTDVPPQGPHDPPRARVPEDQSSILATRG